MTHPPDNTSLPRFVKPRPFKDEFQDVRDERAELEAEITRLRAERPQPEICICAAVKIDDIVIRGHRHSDCLHILDHVAKYREIAGDPVQGFVTSRNRFVDRREGRQLQEQAGIASVDRGVYRGNLLFSEDLY